MADAKIIITTLPHSDFGDPYCCGCLDGYIHENHAEIICNECDVIVRTARISELQKTLDEMGLSLNVASEMCPHCNQVNLFPGFDRMHAFVCRSCGKSVALPM